MSTEHQAEDFLFMISNLIDSSESKYKSGDYKVSILKRRAAKKLVLEQSNRIQSELEFRTFIKKSKAYKSKYNLIEDYKTKIDENRKLGLIKELEKISESKYKSGDFKGAIIALRRSEKFY